MANRKLILNLCTSLDSFIEGPNGEIDWCYTDQDYGMTEFLSQVDTILYGRKSFDQMMEMAPDMFSDKKHIVVSSSYGTSDKVSQVISNNIETEIRALKNAEGKDIWLFGGAKLVTTLLNLNLIDEMIISMHPIILGNGKPLFVDITERKQLVLTNTINYSTGLIQLYYSLVSK